VAIGYFGLIGRLRRFLSPVVIAPTIALIGLALFDAPQITAADQNWWLLGLTVGLIVLFSQYLKGHNRAFQLFPVILGMAIVWLLAAVLSVTGVYTPDSPGYVDLAGVADAPALMAIYPFQWGLPRFEFALAIGMVAGVLASIVESFGDYQAVASLTGSGAPSERRINHGIGMEGLMNVFSGVMGTGGSTSYSENIGAIGLTGVASRYVVQVGALCMLVVGFVGYFGQLVATIPDPIVGGLFVAMFGQIVAVGIGTLKHVDLESQRNVFVVGFAMFVGLAIPQYMANFESAEAFRELAAGVAPMLGSPIFADTVFVIGGTGMAVGGLVALVLDNTIPGTREERGLEEWEKRTEDDSEFESAWERFRNAAD
jgi:xanthine/uracil permease